MSVLPPEHDQSAQADIIDVIMSSIKSLQRCLSIHRVVCLVDFFPSSFPLGDLVSLFLLMWGVSEDLAVAKTR